MTRITSDGRKTIVAETGGGPNGAAFGPDGRLYVCNNGGIEFIERNGQLLPLPAKDDDRRTGWIDAVDPATGKVETLYRECDGQPPKAPNDIVFDTSGGFWFTDHGKLRHSSRDRGAVCYASANSASIGRAIAPMDSPNGIGLSPESYDRIWVTESERGGVSWRLSRPAMNSKGAIRLCRTLQSSRCASQMQSMIL